MYSARILPTLRTSNIIRLLKRIVFRVFKSLAKSQRDLSKNWRLCSTMCRALSTKCQRYTFLTGGNARDSGDPWIQRRDPMSRLFFASPPVSQFFFRKNTQQKLRSWKGGVRTVRRSWCCFCTVSELLLLCAENKEIVFAIWDAIWSLTKFRRSRCAARKSILCTLRLYF